MVQSPMVVGLGDVQVAKGPAVFSALGLGSCIGLCLQDPYADIAGMIHVVLPEAFPDKPLDKPGKFADTGVKFLIDELIKLGANPATLRAAYAGGAQVFKFGPGASDRMDVGVRNAAAVEKWVKELRLKVIAFDTGGSSGRTVTFCSSSGDIKIRTATAGESLLCNLKKR